MRIAIVGGGLAGCAAAFELKTRGHDVAIYEANASVADGASGNLTGLYNPRFGAEWTPQSQYYSKAFELARDLFPHFNEIEHDRSGCMHLINDPKKEIRYSKMLKSWKWGEDDMCIVSEPAASEICGIKTESYGLWLPQSGTVSPPKLCGAYAQDIEIHLNAHVENLEDLDADIIILAAGPALRAFEEAKDLCLGVVRGQVTMIKETPQSAVMKTNICYGGYMTKARDGLHMVGSTFQRWLDHSELIAQDDDDNIARMKGAILTLSDEEFLVKSSRASVRTTARDHFPVVGKLSEKVYVSSAHGSHGILSSLMAAEILGCMIDNKPQSLGDDVIAALSPHRFND